MYFCSYAECMQPSNLKMFEFPSSWRKVQTTYGIWNSSWFVLALVCMEQLLLHCRSLKQALIQVFHYYLGPWPPCWPLCSSDRSCSSAVYKNGPRVIKGQKLRKRKIVCVFFASFKCYIMLKISLWNHLFRRISRFSIQIVRVSCFAPFSVTAFFW